MQGNKVFPVGGREALLSDEGKIWKQLDWDSRVFLWCSQLGRAAAGFPQTQRQRGCPVRSRHTANSLWRMEFREIGGLRGGPGKGTPTWWLQSNSAEQLVTGGAFLGTTWERHTHTHTHGTITSTQVAVQGGGRQCHNKGSKSLVLTILSAPPG